MPSLFLFFWLFFFPSFLMQLRDLRDCAKPKLPFFLFRTVFPLSSFFLSLFFMCGFEMRVKISGVVPLPPSPFFASFFSLFLLPSAVADSGAPQLCGEGVELRLSAVDSSFFFPFFFFFLSFSFPPSFFFLALFFLSPSPLPESARA